MDQVYTMNCKSSNIYSVLDVFYTNKNYKCSAPIAKKSLNTQCYMKKECEIKNDNTLYDLDNCTVTPINSTIYYECLRSFFIECPSQVYVNKSLICQIQFLKPFDLLSDIDNKTVSINIKNLTEIKLNSFENTTFNITLKETGFAEISAIENYFNSSSISLVEVIKTPGKI